MSITSEIRLRVRKEGDVVLNQLSAKLNDVAQRSTLTSAKFKDLSSTLKQTDNQIRTKSINGLNDYARAWRELANSVDITSREFKEATREAQRFEQAAAKAQGRRGGGRLAGMARTAGAVAAAGIFGGPEGLIGAGIGGILGGGAVGAGVGGAIGAQVGMFRQSLGEIATFSAELARQERALEGVVRTQNEYAYALEAVGRATKDFAIPTSVLTREFTKLQASVAGSGGTVEDTEKSFRAIVASIRATGGSIEDVRSALTATAQVFSKGKVSAEELRQQIGERLPGAFTIFAASMNKTPAELDKALEKGEVSLQDFMGFVEKLLDEYEDNAKKIASGPEAAGDRLKVVLEDLKKTTGPILKDIGSSFQSFAADAAQALDGLIKKMVEFGRQMEEKLGGQLLQNAIKNVQIQDRVIKQLEAEALVRVGGLSDTEKQQLQLAKTLRAGSLKVIEGRKLGPELPSAPSKLPGVDTDKTKGKTGKGQPDYSVALANALIAAQNELNPIKKIQLEYDAEILKINESKLKPERKRVAINAANVRLNEQSLKLGNQMAAGNTALFLKDIERNKQIKETIQNLEIEAGIIDEKQARQIEKDRLIQQLQKDGATLTEEQLKRIDEAYEGINKKTSESMQLFKQIGQNVVSALSDAFMSLFDQAKSLREVLTDLLRSTARLFVEFGLRAGMKSLFPSLFANGGIMTGNGPLPLKRYARGGIANSPQLAMFGEGSTPEAYVPLPDGRSIPVRMKGGGGDMGNIVVNVDAAGTAVQGNQPDANKLGEALGIAVRQELIRQKRPGGLLA